MSTIKEILSELKTASHPVARALHKGDHHCKVLVLGFTKGMILNEHQAHVKSKLTVLSGCVTYIEGNRNLKLNQYEEVDIPIDITHSVHADTDSLCLLTQG